MVAAVTLIVLVVITGDYFTNSKTARAAMVGMGLPEWHADAYNEYNKAFSEGLGNFTTNDVEEITGHPARSYEMFARDFSQAFAPASAPTP
jgi:hypothetical protein